MFDQFRRFDTNDDYNLDTQEVNATYTLHLIAVEFLNTAPIQ